jgi:hypothetical protein
MKLTLLHTTFTLLLLLPMFACSTGLVTTVKLKVVDQSQIPVQDARVEISFHGGGEYNDLLTDEAGGIEVTDNGLWGQAILITKRGHYDSTHRTGNGDQDITLELREIKNPIAMYVSRQDEIQAFITENPNKAIGYDLVKGDFTSPHGSGRTSDLIFSGSFVFESVSSNKLLLTVRFSNPLDGFVPFHIVDPDDRWRSDIESSYKSDYLAPENGYNNEWDFYYIAQGSNKKSDSNFDSTRNYYFRVRTKVDEDGNIESAHYGKIYGEFPRITHYFNPTSNDRNVEFELLKNLSRDKIFKP